jgi:hypothetical protein
VELRVQRLRVGVVEIYELGGVRVFVEAENDTP